MGGILATSSGMAQSATRAGSSGLVGVKLGLYSRTHFDGETGIAGEDISLRAQVGSSAQLFADFNLYREFFLSSSFDFYYVEIVRDNQIMLEGSLGLKRTVDLGFKTTRFKPGVAIGFAYLARVNALKPSNYITIKGGVETHFRMTPRRTWLLELAMIQSVHGQNNQYDLAFGPSLIARVGLTFR